MTSLWMVPKPLSEFKQQYTVTKDNNFFELRERVVSGTLLSYFPTSEDFLINMKNDDNWVVSSQMQKKRIMEAWDKVTHLK